MGETDESSSSEEVEEISAQTEGTSGKAQKESTEKLPKKVPLPKRKRKTLGTDYQKNRKGKGGRPKKSKKLEQLAFGDSKQGRLSSWITKKSPGQSLPRCESSSDHKEDETTQNLSDSSVSSAEPSRKKKKSSSGDSGHPTFDPDEEESTKSDENDPFDPVPEDLEATDSPGQEDLFRQNDTAKSSTESLDQNNNVQHLPSPDASPSRTKKCQSSSSKMSENVRKLEEIRDRKQEQEKAAPEEPSVEELSDSGDEEVSSKGLGSKEWSDEHVGIVPCGEKNRRKMKKFEWLVFSGEGYICKVCSIFPKLKGPQMTTFTVKSGPDAGDIVDSFGLRRHEACDEHQKALKLLANASDTSDKALATRRKPAAPTYDDDAIVVMMKMVYFLIRKYQSVTTMYEAFHRFLTEELKHETLVKHKLKYHSGYGQYLSTFSVWEFANALSTTIKQGKLNTIKSREYFSILFDESEDAGHREQMSMFIRTINPRTGEIENHFLDLARVKDRTAKGIYEVVVRWCKEHGVDMSKIVFCGMDTCNTMSGERGGVQSFMKLANAHMIYVPCHNHRVALIFIHLGKKDNFPLVKDFTDTLNQFYMYYKKSSKGRDTRKGVFVEEKEKCYAPIKACPTRWLTIEPQNRKLVDAFTTEVQSLIAILDDNETWTAKDEKGIRCKTLLCSLLDPEMMMLQLALADILPIFNKVQICIQKQTLVFTQIAPLKYELLEQINQVTSARCFEDCTCGQETCYLGQFEERFRWAQRTAQGLKFVNHPYNKFDAAAFWQQTMLPLLEMMRVEVDEGLAFNPVLGGLCYLDPRFYDRLMDIESHGKEEFQKTVEFYATEQKQKKKGYFPNTSKPYFQDPENAIQEFQAAKQLILSFKTAHDEERKIKLRIQHDKKAKIEDEKEKATVRKGFELARELKSIKKAIGDLESDIFDFQALLRKWFSSNTAKGLKDITFLMTMAALVPGSTAIVECSWSVMNLHSDDHSNHLTQEHLNMLMHCSLNQELIDYEHVKRVWSEQKKRKGSKVAPQKE